jgi:hypothetical protein
MVVCLEATTHSVIQDASKLPSVSRPGIIFLFIKRAETRVPQAGVRDVLKFGSVFVFG